MLKLRNVAIVCLLSGLSWNAVASGGFPLQRIWASTLMMPAGMIPILEPRCQARVVPPTEVRKIKGQVLFARLNEVDYLYVGAAKKKVDEPSISAIEALSNLNVRGSSFDLPRARIVHERDHAGHELADGTIQPRPEEPVDHDVSAGERETKRIER